MPNRFRKTAPAVALLVLAALFAGCASKPSGGTAGTVATKQEIIVAANAEPVQFDPAEIGDNPSSGIAGHVMENLARRDNDGKLIAALAESWETTTDGLTWTFHLRKGVKFHDGSAFNADVVKWEFDRILFDQNAPARFRKQWGTIIKEVKAVDADTVQMILKAPNAAFLDLVIMTNGGMIPSKANFDKLGAKDAARNPVGTGALKFKEWVQGQKVILEANTAYWGEKPKLQSLTFRSIPEANTQVIELETGGVHLIPKVGVEDMARLKQNKDVKVESVAGYKVRHLPLNVGRAPFNDQKVRQAVLYALDLKPIIESLVGSMGVPTDSGAIPVASWGYPSSLPTFKQDLAKSKALLTEAGYTFGADGKATKDGKPLAFTFRSPNGRYFADKEISEAVKNQLTKAGFTVDLQIQEWAPFLAKIDAGDFDMTFLGWDQTSPDPSIFMDALVKTNGRGNDAKFSDPAIDAWLNEAVATQDQAKRKELYAKAAAKVNENAWLIPLYNEAKVTGTRTALKGYTMTPANERYQSLFLEGTDK